MSLMTLERMLRSAVFAAAVLARLQLAFSAALVEPCTQVGNKLLAIAVAGSSLLAAALRLMPAGSLRVRFALAGKEVESRTMTSLMLPSMLSRSILWSLAS